MKNTSVVEKETCAVWGFTGTLLWGGVIGLVFIITQLVVMGVYIGFISAAEPGADIESQINQIQFSGNLLAYSTLATLVVCSLLVFVAVEVKKGACFRPYLGLVKVSLKEAGAWLFVAIAFITVADGLVWLLDKPVVPEFMTQVYLSADPEWLLWLALIVAAPIFEELFFRGFLMTGLSRSFVRPAGAVLITSALWAAIHLQYELYILMIIFIMGVLLGIARLRSGSVLLTIGLHSLFNLVAIVEVAIYTS